MKKVIFGMKILRTKGAEKHRDVPRGTIKVYVQKADGSRSWIQVPEGQYRQESKFQR